MIRFTGILLLSICTFCRLCNADILEQTEVTQFLNEMEITHGFDKASLRELHDYSERTFFVAHVGFSRMMEELTDNDLVDYDHDTATATLTDAGRTELV